MRLRILICFNTLLDLALGEGWDNNYDYFEERRTVIEELRRLIEAEQLILYIPPSLIYAAHIAIRESFCLERSREIIQTISRLGNSNLTVDYDRIIEKANATILNVETVELFDVACLFYANALNADAFITLNPYLFGQIVNDNRQDFSDFETPILGIETFLELLSNTPFCSTNGGDYVYVFTPRRKVIELPRKATPIDFAYKIHSQVGDCCVKAFVNGQSVPLDRQLQTGDVVEIMKGQAANPKVSWLDFVVTRTAKRGIKGGIKRVNLKKGWTLIKQVFGENTRKYRQRLEYVAETLGYSPLSDLVSSLGAEKISFDEIVELVRIPGSLVPKQRHITSMNAIENSSMVNQKRNWRIATCCMPLPNEPIVGVVSSNGQPMLVHRTNCNCVTHLNPEQLRSASWHRKRYTAVLRITVNDHPDTLRAILNKLVEEHSVTPDVRDVNTCPDGVARIFTGIPINSRQQLNRVVRYLENQPRVREVRLTKSILSADT